MKTVVYRVKAFSSSCDGGNLAGVVPDGRELSAADMQRVAASAGASETAFIVPSSHGDLPIRWFSPTTEVGGISICTYRVFERANDLHLRKCAPRYGYLEVPVCGLGAGAVAVCLRRRFHGKKYVRIEQRVFLNTPGVVFVAIRKRAIAIGGHNMLCGQHDVTV
jgi:predicted PhzF superfamily epimerase YddE/YHI9